MMKTNPTRELPASYPLNRRGLSVGDRVRLLKLDASFFDDLPADDVAFLKTCVDRETSIEEFTDYGFAEIEFGIPPEHGLGSHTLWVDPIWLEKV